MDTGRNRHCADGSLPGINYPKQQPAHKRGEEESPDQEEGMEMNGHEEISMTEEQLNKLLV